MRRVLVVLIQLYQRTLSFDHGWFRHLYPGGFCRFYPSCSEYGRQCIENHGVLKGGWLTGRRILRCNPMNPGGIDEPPAKRRRH